GADLLQLRHADDRRLRRRSAGQSLLAVVCRGRGDDGGGIHGGVHLAARRPLRARFVRSVGTLSSRRLRHAVLLLPAVVLCNCPTALVASGLSLPFWLDSWATSLAAIEGNLAIAAIGGVLYNLAMALTVWGIGAWVWASSSLTVAFLTWRFY